MNLKEELLYSMALTEAKMKVISTIAEEVYPAVAFQISDYRKDMGKMRDEILGNKRQVSNFEEVMHGALSRKNVVSVMVIGSMVMSACGVIVETGTTRPTEPTTNPAMTETYTSPTETATEIPTAAAVTELPITTATEIPTEIVTELPTETQIPTETATELPTATLTETKIPTSTPTETQIPTEAASEFPAEVHILSPEELAEKKLYGSGFELITDFQGIPVDLTVATSKATLAQYKQTQGCMPNQEMVKYGASAEDRMAEMVFLGHYIGYLRDRGNMKESSYPFEQYIADLKTGTDRSYSIWGPRLDGSDGEWRINPIAPVEYVVTTEKVDPDGNGKGTTLGGGPFGYQQLENGGLRLVNVIGYTTPEYFQLCMASVDGINNMLWYLGADLETLQGKWQLSLRGDLFPISQQKLRELVFDYPTWNKSNHLIELAILVP